MAAGLAATLLALLWPGLPLGPTDLAARLSAWFACDLAAGLWLAIAVARLARHRFFSDQDIDGGCFSLGRLLFFLGYLRGAAARSLGFTLTFYPTVGLLVADGVRLLAPIQGLA